MTELIRGVRGAGGDGGDAAPVEPGEPSPEERRRRLFQLLAFVAVGVALAVQSGNFAAFAVVVSLVVVIMLHELAHFVVARRAGMKTTEFFFGFGPRIWSLEHGETEYGVKAIPVGGYVRIIGMNNLEQVDPADEPYTYRQQSYWWRMAVAVAGSTMHFVIAFVLFFVIFTGVGVPAPTPTVDRIAESSPAATAGFQSGDRLVSVDGRRYEGWREFVVAIRARPEETIEIVVERDDRLVPVTVTPARIELEGEEVGQIGVTPKIGYDRANPIVAFGRSGRELGSTMAESAKALGSFFAPSSLSDYADTLTGREDGAPGERLPEEDTRFLSPVGFGRVANQAAEQGIFEVLALLVLINVFVGIFNLVPLPPFDGGHMAIATYEAIRSKLAGRRYYADASKLMPLTMGVVSLLTLIFVSSLWLDIVDPVANPFE